MLGSGFFKCFLHVSYRLDLKKWQVRNPAEKTSIKERKTEIYKLFKRKMGLLIGYPKPGGCELTNDGNSAQRFFEDSAM